jgi:hypothetical protein
MPTAQAAPPDLHQTLTALIHGRAKTGKSLMAASLTKPLLYLDVELGAQFLPMARRVWDPSTPIPRMDGTWDTAVVRCTSWDDAEAALDQVRSRAHPFKGIAVDSLQALQNRLIGKVAGPTSAVEIQQWGEILRMLQNFTEGLRDMTNHKRWPVMEVLVTCPTSLRDGTWGPHLRGQMGIIAPYLFDLTGYLYVEDEFNRKTNATVQVRKLRTRRTKDIEAGERVGGKIPAIYTLPMVTGTPEEVRKANLTFRKLRADVYRRVDGAPVGIAPPVPSEPPAPPASPPPSGGPAPDVPAQPVTPTGTATPKETTNG